MLVVKQLTHFYQQRRILQIPHLTIAPGERLVLVGPSGSGKSTLLRLLALLEAPTQGQVYWQANGRNLDYAHATITEQRHAVMVFQRPLLLSRSVRANVEYGLRLRGQKIEPARVDAVLQKVALLPLAKANALTLSGGEMQRVALARALVLSPDMLLLDEPTANLDPYNVRVIENFILEEHARYQPTMIIVTHNILQARRLATRIGFILEGELVEINTPDQFFDHPVDPRTRAFLSGDLVC